MRKFRIEKLQCLCAWQCVSLYICVYCSVLLFERECIWEVFVYSAHVQKWTFIIEINLTGCVGFSTSYPNTRMSNKNRKYKTWIAIMNLSIEIKGKVIFKDISTKDIFAAQSFPLGIFKILFYLFCFILFYFLLFFTRVFSDFYKIVSPKTFSTFFLITSIFDVNFIIRFQHHRHYHHHRNYHHHSRCPAFISLFFSS